MSTFIRACHMPAWILMLSMVGIATPVRAQTEVSACRVISPQTSVITAAGVYCLTADRASGVGISVQADDVVIDCNHHRIEAPFLSAGSGIASVLGKSRMTVRRCTVRGFNRGIDIKGGSSHVVEDNLIDRSRTAGIDVGSSSQPSNTSAIRRNRVVNTGTSSTQSPRGISVNGSMVQVLDNQVSGLIAEGSASSVAGAAGIGLFGTGHVVRGNTVTQITVAGIRAILGGRIVRDNSVVNVASTVAIGINAPAICRNNSVRGFSIPVNCAGGVASGNLALP
jgi:Right handed beta helix region